MTPLRTLQRHLAFAYLPVAAVLVVVLLNTTVTDPELLAIWAIGQGVGVVWIGSGAWELRERWAVRLQVTFVGLAISFLLTGNTASNVAAVGLLVFAVALVFLHLAHVIGRSLYLIQNQLTTAAAWSRVEGARQVLFYLTFAAPFALAVAPNVIGVGFLVASGCLVGDFVTRRARRRLTNGLARAAAE